MHQNLAPQRSMRAVDPLRARAPVHRPLVRRDVACAPSWWRDRALNRSNAPQESGGVADELRAARLARNEPRALGVDYGARRIGLAVSDGHAPRPLEAFEHRGSATTSESARRVVALAAEECCDRIVVGVPKQPGKAAKNRAGRGRGAVRMDLVCARFAGEVADACARSEDAHARRLTVYTLDESRTSVEAAERMADVGSSASVDSASAAILLERYFDGSYGEPRVVRPQVA